MSEAAAHTPLNLTVSEMSDSLTGHEEDEIETHMGVDYYAVAAPRNEGGRYAKALRCLVFVQRRREGLDPAAARKAALDLRSDAVAAIFADDPEEIDPEAPETPVGKDSSSDDSAPVDSPHGAS